ncbi:MAG: hypothetical protein LBS56_06245 [Propionibacteriaceae bacterium]|jgi:ABC-type glycerol-3-phosphate transport system permease component|nr:hypothetical protein [Propionibacteriaceae bacterium]
MTGRTLRSKWARTLVAALAAAAVFTPFAWMISQALKDATESYSYPPQLIPSTPTVANFVYVWEKTNLPLAFANSMVVSVVAVVSNVVFAVAAGYAIARLRFRGRNLMFTAMVGAPWCRRWCS